MQDGKQVIEALDTVQAGAFGDRQQGGQLGYHVGDFKVALHPRFHSVLKRGSQLFALESEVVQHFHQFGHTLRVVLSSAFGGGNHGAIGGGCTFLHLLEAHAVGHLAVDQVERSIGITAVFSYELGYQVADLLLTCGGNPIRCFAAIFAKSLPCYLADIGFKLFLVVHARFEHGISTHTGSSHCSHGAAQALPPAAGCTCATAQFVIQPLQVAAVGLRRAC